MILLGFVTGLLAGAVHLALVALRATLVGRGRLLPSVLLAPLGVACPLLAVYAFAGSPGPLFTTIAGLLVARGLLVTPLGRWVEVAWTP